MSISPTTVTISSMASSQPTTFNTPPSPQAHRSLRRLQSASNLHVASSRAHQNSSQSGLITQQRQNQQDEQQQYQQTNDGGGSFSPFQKDLQHISHGRSRSNSDAAVMSITSTGPLGRRQAVGRKIVAADALSLDRLIREGPPDGDVASALSSTRLKILDQGIKSDNDGMVGRSPRLICRSELTSIVLVKDLHLAHSPERTSPFDGYLSVSDPSRRLTRLLQNPQ
jgi:cell cycle arrest protein BUB2